MLPPPSLPLSRGPRWHAGALLAALFGSGGGLLMASTLALQGGGGIQVASAQAHHSDPAALALWKRTLRAQEEKPLRAKATVTLWKSKDNHDKPLPPEVIDVIEGAGGRYRFTYLAPPPVRGRIIVSDGKTLYQYEPARQVVIKRPAINSREQLFPDEEAFSTRSAHLKADGGSIAGHPVQVLELRSANTGSPALEGRLRERRWIDRATGRSLRTEEYAPSGSLLRRVELSSIEFAPVPGGAEFQPHFPSTARILAVKAQRPLDAGQEARRLRLPPLTSGYRVRSVVLPTPGAAAAHSHQFLYSNGLHAISLFVTKRHGNNISYLRPEAGWKTVSLTKEITGEVRPEDAQGRSAVAWVKSGRRYIAIARLPLAQLLAVARGLVTTAALHSSLSD